MKTDKKFWINFISFAAGGFLLIYLYTKYRVAPDINFKDLQVETTDGKQIHISDYKGKLVFINFWQTWCGPCCQEMPSIDNLKQQLDSSKIVFMTVTDEDPGRIESFLSNKNYSVQFLHSNKKLTELGINSYPTTYILDGEGKILMTKIGGVEWNLPGNVELVKGMMK